MLRRLTFFSSSHAIRVAARYLPRVHCGAPPLARTRSASGPSLRVVAGSALPVATARASFCVRPTLLSASAGPSVSVCMLRVAAPYTAPSRGRVTLP
jgi:hypothetical protein